MNVLRKLRNYVCYCGIDKEEYKAVKKYAYASNYYVWRVLHLLMALVFGVLLIVSLINGMLNANLNFYIIAFAYSIAATVLFFILKKDSVLAQLFIYLTISMLFLIGALVTQNKPNTPATSFIVFLLITPMFMIDKPYFMAIELTAASAVFLIWMYFVKPFEVWQYDLINIIIYATVGIFLHIIANSIRIREFVLTRTISIQKDTDEMTGLKNKGALTSAINAFLADEAKDKGILFVLDIDHFKSINDTYGHDVGDSVISQLGKYLKDRFTSDEIVGRFGGDEYIIFIKDNDNPDYAEGIAKEITKNSSNHVLLPDEDRKITVSMGVAIYHGEENNYSELFKKADVALYKTKADRSVKYNIY